MKTQSKIVIKLSTKITYTGEKQTLKKCIKIRQIRQLLQKIRQIGCLIWVNQKSDKDPKNQTFSDKSD